MSALTPTSRTDYRTAFQNAVALTVNATCDRQRVRHAFHGEICSLGETRWLFRRTEGGAEEYLVWDRENGVSHVIGAAIYSLGAVLECTVEDPSEWALWLKSRRI